MTPRIAKKVPSDLIVMYTDGGSRGNPGPSAIGVYIIDAKGNPIKSYGEAIGTRTNNEAEYAAVVFGLKKLKALLGKEKTRVLHVEVRADSELLIRQLSHLYKIESENVVPLFIQIWNLTLDFGQVTFRHVPREKNRAADRLVNQALDKSSGSLFL